MANKYYNPPSVEDDDSESESFNSLLSMEDFVISPEATRYSVWDHHDRRLSPTYLESPKSTTQLDTNMNSLFSERSNNSSNPFKRSNPHARSAPTHLGMAHQRHRTIDNSGTAHSRISKPLKTKLKSKHIDLTQGSDIDTSRSDITRDLEHLLQDVKNDGVKLQELTRSIDRTAEQIGTTYSLADHTLNNLRPPTSSLESDWIQQPLPFDPNCTLPMDSLSSEFPSIPAFDLDPNFSIDAIFTQPEKSNKSVFDDLKLRQENENQ
uniref:Uncharacterized protein n=1 Tax=Kwoniella pini CBS 10737 TaxID=1296096 RepID=A0A1B9HSA6_9TREE|nr:uncharacterized protein I206_07902 [Kwoniella pini CBS 10737]OCF46117.1 hypothetical protein I206_07902 [Kwoniella pini CBS 10737]